MVILLGRKPTKNKDKINKDPVDAYGDYENTGTKYLVGYDWTVGDFTLGFYYSDFNHDTTSASDEDGGYFTISY